jgi:hypothetical protein
MLRSAEETLKQQVCRVDGLHEQQVDYMVYAVLLMIFLQGS